MFFEDFKVRDSLLVELRTQQGTSFRPFMAINVKDPIAEELGLAVVIGSFNLFEDEVGLWALSKVVELRRKYRFDIFRIDRHDLD